MAEYVSRGGYKLEAALEGFKIFPADKICLDVGASTGGFTDCLLKRGAGKVYAVDVGRGQFDWTLRQNPRVVLYEKINARYLEPSLFSSPPGLATVDVSFISLTKILSPLVRVLAPGFEILALIKPNFEVGPRVAKKGVVRDESERQRVLLELQDFAKSLNLQTRGILPSPLKGPKGNVEYLWYLKRIE